MAICALTMTLGFTNTVNINASYADDHKQISFSMEAKNDAQLKTDPAEQSGTKTCNNKMPKIKSWVLSRKID